MSPCRAVLDGRQSPLSNGISSKRGISRAPIAIAVESSIAQLEDAIETIENLLVMGDGDDRGVLFDGELAKKIHHDLRAL